MIHRVGHMTYAGGQGIAKTDRGLERSLPVFVVSLVLFPLGLLGIGVGSVKLSVDLPTALQIFTHPPRWRPLRLLPWLSLCPTRKKQLGLSLGRCKHHLLLLGLQDLPAHFEAVAKAAKVCPEKAHRTVELPHRLQAAGRGSPMLGTWAFRVCVCFCFGFSSKHLWQKQQHALIACVAMSLLGRLLFSHADFAWSFTT